MLAKTYPFAGISLPPRDQTQCDRIATQMQQQIKAMHSRVQLAKKEVALLYLHIVNGAKRTGIGRYIASGARNVTQLQPKECDTIATKEGDTIAAKGR